MKLRIDDYDPFADYLASHEFEAYSARGSEFIRVSRVELQSAAPPQGTRMFVSAQPHCDFNLITGKRYRMTIMIEEVSS